MCGYSFNDGHLNDTIVNALIANPTAMVLGLMFGNYEKEPEAEGAEETYPEAYRLAKKQHNLNIWTFDKAIIGTNVGKWKKMPNEDDSVIDLLQFVSIETTAGDPPTTHELIKLGDFSVFTDFLKRIIGTTKDHQNG